MWVALAEGEDWPVPRRRALIAAAVMLYQLRGTRTGIKQHVSIFAGSVTLVMERTDGFRLDSEARLGINTMVGRDLPHTFTVTIAAYDPDSIDLDTVRAILEGDKPIETSYRLRVVPFTGDAPAAGAEERSQY